MYDLISFQRDILYVVAGLTEPHGLAIKAELDEYYEQEINHSRLYPNLDDLVDNGFLEKGKLDKRTNKYTITQRGRQKIAAEQQWKSQYLD